MLKRKKRVERHHNRFEEMAFKDFVMVFDSLFYNMAVQENLWILSVSLPLLVCRAMVDLETFEFR